MRITYGKGSAGIINLPRSARVNAQRLRNSVVQRPNISTGILSYQQTNWQVIPYQPVLGLEGLTLSNNVILPNTAINIDAGYAWTTIGVPQLAQLPLPLTKFINAPWAIGTSQGGRFPTTLVNSPQTYHLFLINNQTTGAVDVGFDDNILASNRPIGWSARRIGSVLWTGTAIRQFIQHGWMFEFNPPVTDLAGVIIPTSPTSYTLSVPQGIPVKAYGVFSPGLAAQGSNLTFSIQSTAQTPLTPVDNPGVASYRGNASCYFNALGEDLLVLAMTSSLTIPTNAFGQIRIMRNGLYFGANRYSTWVTHGWVDDLLLRGT